MLLEDNLVPFARQNLCRIRWSWWKLISKFQMVLHNRGTRIRNRFSDLFPLRQKKRQFLFGNGATTRYYPVEKNGLLSTSGQGSRPPKSPIGGSWVQTNIFWRKIKNKTTFNGYPPLTGAALARFKPASYRIPLLIKVPSTFAVLTLFWVFA